MVMLQRSKPKRRRKMPSWLIRRSRLGPNGSQRWYTVGVFRARNQDEAIRKAAHAIRHIAILQAIKIEDGEA